MIEPKKVYPLWPLWELEETGCSGGERRWRWLQQSSNQRSSSPSWTILSQNYSKLEIITAHLWLMIIKNLRMYPALRAPMLRIQPSLDLSDVSGLLTDHTEHSENRTHRTHNITEHRTHRTYLANSIIKITKTWCSGPSKALCNFGAPNNYNYSTSKGNQHWQWYKYEDTRSLGALWARTYGWLWMFPTLWLCDPHYVGHINCDRKLRLPVDSAFTCESCVSSGMVH